MDDLPSYKLKWNHHVENVVRMVEHLYKTSSLTDVSLAVTDSPYTIQCHKMVLVACSTYFRDLILKNYNKKVGDHLVICLEGVKYDEISTLLDYMYNGEVRVAQKDLENLLNVARRLKVKGLDVDSETLIKNEVDETNHNGYHHSQHSSGSSYDVHDKSTLMDRVRTSLDFDSDWNGPVFPTSQPSSIIDHSVQRPGLAGSYESDLESSPLKLKKYSSTLSMSRDLMMDQNSSILKNVLGQSYPDSSQVPALPPSDSHQKQNYRRRSCRNTVTNEPDKNVNMEISHSETEQADQAKVELDNAKRESEQLQSEKNGESGCDFPNRKWKRYKNYTQFNLEAALSDVQNGMQTLKAATYHGVPSRTLYDKIKRLGIKRERPVRRSSKNANNEKKLYVSSYSNHTSHSSYLNSSSACFPYGIGRNVDGSIYNNRINYSDSENDRISLTSNGDSNFVTAFERLENSPEPINEISQSDAHVVAESSLKRQSDEDDSAEDLSMNRTSNVRTVPSTTIKEEIADPKCD